jgi:formylmethanofuran dehydrogenase subunit D
MISGRRVASRPAKRNGQPGAADGIAGILVGMAREQFILIPGRTSRQGTTLNEGKFSAGYVEETATVQMNPEDMARLGLKTGDSVRLRSDQGEVAITCQAAKAGDLPPGLLFLPYGDASSRLMGGDTQGTGMPNSKGIDVEVEGA